MPISRIKTDGIQDDAITSAKIVAGSVAATDIADGAITTAKIATDAVTSAKIVDGAVVVADVADGSITTVKLAADAVTAAKLADDSVVTANIVDGNVTAVKTTGVGKGKNLIINGAMQVAQRTTSATAVSGAGVYNTIDRLKLWEDTDGAFTTEQSTEAPVGFSKSVKLQVTTADTSLAAGQYATFGQSIEAQNLQHLAYGTTSAKTITVSFYVRSNKTGTYCLAVDKEDSTTYKYVKEFSITSADTWERKTITIVPDSNIKASGGAITDDTGRGLRIFFGLAWGSTYTGATNEVWSNNGNHYATSNQVNWLDSTSNNFYFTGFQVEVGDNATDFEHRSFAEELRLCQRYFSKSAAYSIAADHNLDGDTVVVLVDMANGLMRSSRIYFPVKMRATPTVTQLKAGTGFGSANGQWAWYQSGTWTFYAFNSGNANEDGFCAHGGVGGAGDGQSYWTHAAWKAGAEL